ncbi:MAG: hypothetical protein ACR2JK_16655 [Geodermatophilaceae bacterium]
MVTPQAAEISSGVVCLAFDSLDPLNAVGDLLTAGYGAGLTPYRTGYMRVGPSIVTTPDEVDGLVAAIADLL